MSTHGARNLVIDSATGVELTLPVAGTGARCLAFLVDWVIRAILFSAWYAVAALAYNGRWSFAPPMTSDARWFGLVVVPAAALYCLYHPVLEIALHGRTPGKRMAGVHIVMRNGGSPNLGALLIRNVFRLVDSLPLFYGIGLLATLVTRDHIRIGDMAAGTVLVYERYMRPPLSPRAEIAGDLLIRWPSLNGATRRQLAIDLLGKSQSEATDDELRARLESLAQRP